MSTWPGEVSARVRQSRSTDGAAPVRPHSQGQEEASARKTDSQLGRGGLKHGPRVARGKCPRLSNPSEHEVNEFDEVQRPRIL